MKVKLAPIKANILVAVMMFALSDLVRAQFLFTTNNGAITITGCSGNPVTLTVPSSTNGYPITTIGGAAFNSLSKLTTVTFPSSITNLSNGAFAYCSSLTGVYFQGNAPGLGGGGCVFPDHQCDYVLPAWNYGLGFEIIRPANGVVEPAGAE
jgi:hypothetical protein